MSTAQNEEVWHALEADQVLVRLHSHHQGLTQEEAKRRLSQYGINRLPVAAKKPWWRRLLSQFNNLLIYILLLAAVVTLAIGHWLDASVILAVTVINALIGFIQEGKAASALEAIRRMLSPSAAVWRDGRLVSLDAEKLVPGDVVSLQAGDKVPADIRLLRCHDLRVDEAILTGESLPEEKQVQPVASMTGIADRQNMAYTGTLVTYGRATGVVTTTGSATEIGRISTLLEEVKSLTTPLLRQMDHFARWLTVAIALFCLATFLFGIYARDYATDVMFLAAVGLAVSAIPEGLPAIMTIALAIGVERMAHRRAIVRRLAAVETLGSVTTICCDKTGTLTRNEMMVQSVLTGRGEYQVSGQGYDPHGAFYCQQQALPTLPQELKELCQAALLCNDAELVASQGRWQMHGDPTEGALVVMAMKAGLEVGHLRKSFPRIDVIPFEAERRFMATLHHDHRGHSRIFIKGAPEEILDMCSAVGLDGETIPLDKEAWLQHMHEMASRGLRLLALAEKRLPKVGYQLTYEDFDYEVILLGLTGMIDPPRDEAIHAISQCRAAGIRVKMITGDHARTAEAIAAQMNLSDRNDVITGDDLEGMDAQQMRDALLDYNVFARTSPEHKLRLVEALQAGGEVVAMTGDGVNDAPALKRADVGVAMGKKGTEVSKEAAEIVLTDDNFASIVDAVREGRNVYDNLKKSILFVLPTNGGEALSILGAIFMGYPLPVTPVQILWINMVTTVTLALVLAFEPAESNIMQRPPRDPQAPLLDRFLSWRIIFVSIIMAAATLGLFIWQRSLGVTIEEARTVAVNTLVVCEIFYLFNSRYLSRSSFSLSGIGGNRYALYACLLLLLLQAIFTYLPLMQNLFSTTAINLHQWSLIAAVSAGLFLLVELEKAALRHRPHKS